MSFILDNFCLLGGEGKAKRAFQIWLYKSYDELKDVVSDNYFKDVKERLFLDDIIIFFNPKNKNDYELHYLKITTNNSATDTVIANKIYMVPELSDILPKPDDDVGFSGVLKEVSRCDHQHPKVIATEEDRGQIIIANEEEAIAGEDNSKAITPLKNQMFFENKKASDDEVKNGEDIYKYINPKQMKTEIDNVVNSNYLDAFWFGKTTEDFEVPLPTDINQNYFDFTSNKIFIANDDLSGWMESKTIKPKNGSKVGISSEFWDIVEKGFSGFAIYSKDSAKWDYYPDKTLKYDNETIVPRESDGALKVADNIVNKKGDGNNLFDFKFMDHVLNNQSWLRSDTFSWHDGAVYSNAYNHLLEDYNGAEDVYLSSNISLMGALQDNRGILSGFSNNNYARLYEPFRPEDNTWEMAFKIKLSTLNRANIIFGASSAPNDGLLLGIDSNNTLHLWLSSDRTSWNIADINASNFIISANTDYYIKVEFTGTQYKVSYSTDGKNWIVVITVDSSLPIYSMADLVNIGIEGYNTNQYFAGSIDLNKSYININNNRWWSGATSYKLAADGHKIVDIANENIVEDIYNNTGIAWYYILDIQNQRFKLPRSQWNFVGVRSNGKAADYVEAGLPNITGQFHGGRDFNPTGAFYGSRVGGGWGKGSSDIFHVNMDASRISKVYGNSDTVQQKATQMLLYFYVGEFNRTATEQTAGLNSELFNNKVDLDGKNADFPVIVEKYDSPDGDSWYRKYSDGWIEQGGIDIRSGGNGLTINLLKPMLTSNYNVFLTYIASNSDPYSICLRETAQTYFLYNRPTASTGAKWYISGYAAEEE